MDLNESNLLTQFAEMDGTLPALDFGEYGKADEEDYKLAVDYMDKNASDKIGEVFAEFISGFTGKLDASALESVQNGTDKLHFIENTADNIFSVNETDIDKIDLSFIAGLNASQTDKSMQDIVLDLKIDDNITETIEKQCSDILSCKITDYEEKQEKSFMEDFVSNMDIQTPIEDV